MASLDEMLHEIRRIEEHRVTLTEKKIKSIYKSLEKDLTAFISDEYIKYSDGDGRLYLSYLDSKNKRAKFLQEIVANVDSISPKVKRELLDLVDKTYEKSYKGIAKAVKSADDTKELISSTKTLVRPEVLKRAVNNNIEKLTLDAVMEKHRAEIIADIQQTLNVGLMQGDRYETMAKRIQERLGVSYSKASNIARTESHRNIESGMMDGAKETAKIIEQDGNLIYAAVWKTMKDERVRPQVRRKTKKGWKTTISKNGANHQKMHGVTIKVGEQFQLEPDVFAECPGMSGTARNDCRCRCYLSYKLMTVEEFAKATGQSEKEVRAKYDLQSPEEEKSFVAAESIDDAEKYAGKFASTVSYRGAKSIDDVNIVNRTLDDLTTRFPTKQLDSLSTNSRLKRAQARANYSELEIQTKFLNGEHIEVDWQERIKKNDALIEKYKTEYLGNQRYNQSSVRKAIKQLEEEKKFTRWTYAGEDVAATVAHEYGHILADQYIGQINGKRANSQFAHNTNNKLYQLNRTVDKTFRQAVDSGDIFNISMYANTNSHEFFAETFSMYAMGEKLPDYIEEMLKEVLNVGIV